MSKAKPGPKAGPRDGDGLNGGEAAFVEHYLQHRVAKDAAIAAGYAPKSAHVHGPAMLRRPHVKAVVDARTAVALDKATVTLQRVVEEIAKGAFADVRSMFGPNGGLKPPKDWPDDIATLLAGMEVVEAFGNDGNQVGFTRKVKLGDRRGYLDMLMKHLGGYAKDNEQAGKAAAGSLAELLAGIQRSALPVVAQPDAE